MPSRKTSEDPSKNWKRRYAIEFSVALVAFWLSSHLCIPRAITERSMSLRLLWSSIPALCSLLLAIAVVRHFKRVDEYIRSKMVESLAFAAATIGVFCIAYGFFEVIGLPRLSSWWIWPMIAIASAVRLVWVEVRGR